jgi:Txe/YoeB family toxin of Txe-Axe toxin-antitoxin module
VNEKVHQVLAKKMQFKEVENFQKLQRTNDELKAKIESLTEKIKSDDTKNRFELEVNSKFESLIKEKTLLELENGNLSRKVFDLTEKLREEEIVSKTELKEVSN